MSVKKILVTVTVLVILGSSLTLLASGQPDVTRPRNLWASGNDGYVQLEWQAPAFGDDRVNEYRIYRRLTAQKIRYASVNSETLNFRDNDVENGRTYYYWVTAIYDGNRETDFSNEASATPTGLSPPTAPRNLKAYPGNLEIELKWDAPYDDGGSLIRNYHIHRGTSANNLEHRYTVGTTGTYNDRDVMNGQTYYYGVKAVNDEGVSELSNIDSATPSADITAPSAPRNLRTLVGNRLIELFWEAPHDDGGSAVQSYRIERTDLAPPFNSNYPFYSDDSVTNGVTYTYVVRAINIEGMGPPSNEVMATPTSLDIPPAPGDLYARGTTLGITLTWSRPTTELEITDYNIYRGRNENELTFLVSTTGSTSYDDMYVEVGKTYYYMVRAVSGNKLSLESNIDSATVLEGYSPVEDDSDDARIPFLGILVVLLIAVVATILIFALLKKRQEHSSNGEPPAERGWQHEDTDPTFTEDPSTTEGMIDRKEDDEWTIRS